MKKKRNVELSDTDSLAMFRCAMYSKMGVTNDDAKPTDRQCIEWLQYVCAQAEHRIDGPLLARQTEQIVKTTKVHGGEIIIRRSDLRIGLPEWKNLPA